MTPNPATVAEHADLVEELHGTGEVFALTWHAGDAPKQRAWLLDHHGAIVNELRRRGRIPHATVVRDEHDTERYAIRSYRRDHREGRCAARERSVVGAAHRSAGRGRAGRARCPRRAGNADDR